jgi:hypothetical protein
VEEMLSKHDAKEILPADDMSDYCLSLLNHYVLEAAVKRVSEVHVPYPRYPKVSGLIQSLSKSKGTFRCIDECSHNTEFIHQDFATVTVLSQLGNCGLFQVKCVKLREFKVVYCYIAYFHAL